MKESRHCNRGSTWKGIWREFKIRFRHHRRRTEVRPETGMDRTRTGIGKDKCREREKVGRRRGSVRSRVGDRDRLKRTSGRSNPSSRWRSPDLSEKGGCSSGSRSEIHSPSPKSHPGPTRQTRPFSDFPSPSLIVHHSGHDLFGIECSSGTSVAETLRRRFVTLPIVPSTDDPFLTGRREESRSPPG